SSAATSVIEPVNSFSRSASTVLAPARPPPIMTIFFGVLMPSSSLLTMGGQLRSRPRGSYSPCYARKQGLVGISIRRDNARQSARPRSLPQLLARGVVEEPRRAHPLSPQSRLRQS